jgi:hypothetical protein
LAVRETLVAGLAGLVAAVGGFCAGAVGGFCAGAVGGFCASAVEMPSIPRTKRRALPLFISGPSCGVDRKVGKRPDNPDMLFATSFLQSVTNKATYEPDKWHHLQKLLT